MNWLPANLAAIHSRWAPVEDRVREILSNVRRSCDDRIPGEGANDTNERHMEQFVLQLKERFPGCVHESEAAPDGPSNRPHVLITRQRLSRWAVRTTRWNFVFTVPGESVQSFLLVAHYDTWGGPGADDNTTGEEILKQYLTADLQAEQKPPVTHVYFFAGSEECGLVGLLSQLLLAVCLTAAIQAWQQHSWWSFLFAILLCPLASYRFGVSGSREYVRSLKTEELKNIEAVLSVDSVGEGRLFIPRSSMGADFIRALIPFGEYGSFNDLLQEGAHLHGIKFNNYLAGGTTDHVSFLEVNNGIVIRSKELIGRLFGKPQPLFRISAAALVAMLPGKASPLVFGGKIHTRQDVPSRVYPEPVRETLLIIDYAFHILDGGSRVAEPRDLDRFHYARLYQAGNSDAAQYWLALKDAVEPNRRNLNAVYRVEATIHPGKKEAEVKVIEPVSWGVETKLRKEVAELAQERGVPFQRVRIQKLILKQENQNTLFERRLTWAGKIFRTGDRVIAALERLMGRYSFITYFVTAYLLVLLVNAAVDFLMQFNWFLTFLIDTSYVSIPFIVILHLGTLLYLMVRTIPTWIDNHYRHENRADNWGSLCRTPLQESSTS